jgi:two-component system chemotaxis sensor kinase CheA
VGEAVCSRLTRAEVEEGAVNGSLHVALVSTVDAERVRAAVAGVDDVAELTVEPLEVEQEEAPAPASGGAEAGAEQTQRKGVATTQTVRIDVERLDELMSTIGELVMDRTRIVEVAKALEGRYKGDDMVDALTETSSHIIRVVDELQEHTRRVRMQQIGTVFSSMPRMVRDLAQKMGKKLELVIEGNETEIDRTVIERIKDPLVHLLRNAVDHGMETPDERRAAGKRETGRLHLRAYHEQGHILITVEDDGRGIDGEKVKNSMMAKGLITADAASRLTETEARDLIFMAGASTKSKEETTDVSGRGVGMDIVRANIEALHGFVHVETEVGKWTRFTMRLPLSLATVQALLVEVKGTTYAVPLIYVLESLWRPESEIETVAGTEVIRLRGEVVPLVRLSRVMGIESNLAPPSGDAYVVVVRLGERLIGLGVDAINVSQEIVVKPLSGFLGSVAGLAGVSILGDGTVVLIVDVPTLINAVVQRKSTGFTRAITAGAGL